MRAGGTPRISGVLRLCQSKRVAQALCTFMLIFCLAAPAVAAKKRSSHKRKPATKTHYPLPDNLLVSEMLRHLGVQYQRGGSSESGVDCSGYVRLVYQNVCGLTLPHHSESLYLSSDLQEVPSDELKTGDLLFFTTSLKSRRISHVGIYLSKGRFVHAASRKGVIVSNLEENYYRERFAGARRVPQQLQWRNEDADSSILSAPGTGPGNTGNGLEMSRQSLGLELGINRDFHVELFQDWLFSWKKLDPEFASHDGYRNSEGYSLSAQVQEVRFGKDIKLLPWLVVTPSLSYFDYRGDLDESGLPRRSAGIDLSLGSRKNPSRISTGFRYLSLIPARAYADGERAPKGLDMSLSYSRRLSDGSLVSVVGERLQRHDAPAPLSHQEELFEEQRFSIIFNFSY
ncbi:MAG: C40 family peptidase [Desulfobacterales bacterium]|nr:C40 family peptidase [Desulfobacterales bacterium]